MRELNYCPSCKRDFGSLKAFDAHRVGVHAYTYSEGIRLEPMREDGRRCLFAEEYGPLGLRLDRNGRWGFPVSEATLDRLSRLRGS